MTERLDIGAILGRVFQYYREQAGVLLPAALIVFVPIAIVAGVLIAADAVIVGLLGGLALYLIGVAWYQAMVVEAVRDIQDGRRDLSIGELFGAAARFIGPVIATGLVVALLTLLGLVFFVVPGLIVMTIFAVAIPTVVLEQRGTGEALRRSRELVKGNGWQVFAVIVVIAILHQVVSRILVAIFSGIGDVVGGILGSLIANVLIAPLGAIAATVLYLELRRIKEGTAPPAGPVPEAPGTLPGVPGSTTPPPPPPPPGTPPPPPPPPG